MRIFITLKRLVRILFVPKKEWVAIASETASIGLVIKYYAWPFIVFAALIKAGSVYIKFSGEANLNQFKIPFTFTILLFYMFAPLFVILVGGSLINRYKHFITSAGHKNGSFRLLIYSFTPFFLAAILINLESHLPYMHYIGLISIYSVVLFWIGMEPLLHIPSERKAEFLIISSMILFFLFFIAMLFIRISLNVLYPEGVVLFL